MTPRSDPMTSRSDSMTPSSDLFIGFTNAWIRKGPEHPSRAISYGYQVLPSASADVAPEGVGSGPISVAEIDGGLVILDRMLGPGLFDIETETTTFVPGNEGSWTGMGKAEDGSLWALDHDRGLFRIDADLVAHLEYDLSPSSRRARSSDARNDRPDARYPWSTSSASEQDEGRSPATCRSSARLSSIPCTRTIRPESDASSNAENSQESGALGSGDTHVNEPRRLTVGLAPKRWGAADAAASITESEICRSEFSITARSPAIRICANEARS